MGRTWKMYASASDRSTELGNILYLNVYPHPSSLRMSGIRPENILAVDVVEDADGEYLGWIAKDDTKLRMVQQKRIFPIQFPYSVQEEVDAGTGEAVPLSIRQTVE